MATYPFKVSGACRSTDNNVYRVKFSQPISSVPELRCYDNANTFPVVGASTATTFTIFQGSAAMIANANGKGMLIFLDTRRAGPAASNWYAAPEITGAKATVRMCGDKAYLKFRYSATAASLVANSYFTWNSIMEVPCDVNPTMSRLHDVVVRYTFTSTIPAVSFHANNLHAGGSNAVPAWGTITPSSQGVRFGAVTATNTSILANIPLAATASLEVTRTGWVAET